jgi:mycofactocin precursor
MDDTALATEIDDTTHTTDTTDELLDELLVEEISIDGMCGVY